MTHQTAAGHRQRSGLATVSGSDRFPTRGLPGESLAASVAPRKRSAEVRQGDGTLKPYDLISKTRARSSSVGFLNEDASTEMMVSAGSVVVRCTPDLAHGN